MNPGPHLGAFKIRTLPERQYGSQASEETSEGGVVLPAAQFASLEPFGELWIGQQRLPSQIGTGTDKRNPKIVGEEADRIQEDPLLSPGPRQHAVDLIQDDDPRGDDPQQGPANILFAGQRSPRQDRRVDGGQQFPVEIPL